MAAVSYYPASPLFQRKQPRTQPESFNDHVHSENERPLERMKQELKQRTVSRSLVEEIITNVLSNHSNKLQEKTNIHDIQYVKETKPPPKRAKEAPIKSTTYIKRAQQVMPPNILNELKDEITKKPGVQKQPSQKMEVRVKVTTTRCTRKQVTTGRRVMKLNEKSPPTKHPNGVVTPDMQEKKKIIENLLMKSRQHKIDSKEVNQRMTCDAQQNGNITVDNNKETCLSNGVSGDHRINDINSMGVPKGSNESPSTVRMDIDRTIDTRNLTTAMQTKDGRKGANEKVSRMKEHNGIHVKNGNHFVNGTHVTKGEHVTNRIHIANGSRDVNGTHGSSVMYTSHGTFVTNATRASHGRHSRTEKSNDIRRTNELDDRNGTFEVVKVEFVNNDEVRPIRQKLPAEVNDKRLNKQRKCRESDDDKRKEKPALSDARDVTQARKASVAEKTTKLFQSLKDEKRSKQSIRKDIRQYFADLQEIKSRLQLQQRKKNARPRDIDDQTKLKGIVKRLKPMFEEMPLPPQNILYNKHGGMFTYNITTRSEKMESRLICPFNKHDKLLCNTKRQQDEKSRSNEKIDICDTLANKTSNVLKLSQSESKLTYTLENVKKYVSGINPSLVSSKQTDAVTDKSFSRLNAKETIPHLKPMHTVYEMFSTTTRNCKTYM